MVKTMKNKKALAGILLSLTLAGGVIAPVATVLAADETTSVAPATEVATEAPAPAAEPVATEAPAAAPTAIETPATEAPAPVIAEVPAAAPATEASAPAVETASATEAAPAVAEVAAAEVAPAAESAPVAAPVNESATEQPITFYVGHIGVNVGPNGEGAYLYATMHTIHPGETLTIYPSEDEDYEPIDGPKTVTYEQVKAGMDIVFLYKKRTTTTEEPKTSVTTTTEEPKTSVTTTTEEPKTSVTTTTEEPKTTAAAAPPSNGEKGSSSVTKEPKKVLPNTGETGSVLAVIGLVMLAFVGLIGATYKHKE